MNTQYDNLSNIDLKNCNNPDFLELVHRSRQYAIVSQYAQKITYGNLSICVSIRKIT